MRVAMCVCDAMIALELKRLGFTYEPERIIGAVETLEAFCTEFDTGQDHTPGQYFIWEPWLVRAVREFRNQPTVPNDGPVLDEAYAYVKRMVRLMRLVARGKRSAPRVHRHLVGFLVEVHRSLLAEESDGLIARFAA